MKIGIDISQAAFEGTGVGNYITSLTKSLIENDKENEYILFFSSLRRQLHPSIKEFENINNNVKIKSFKLPPLLLDILWNRLHILPIEWFLGELDIFISSDWTQPPILKAKNITIFYDLIVYKYPEETAKKIIDTQKRRLNWVKKECEKIICISEATKNDAKEILKIKEDRLLVVYPGI